MITLDDKLIYESYLTRTPGYVNISHDVIRNPTNNKWEIYKGRLSHSHNSGKYPHVKVGSKVEWYDRDTNTHYYGIITNEMDSNAMGTFNQFNILLPAPKAILDVTDDIETIKAASPLLDI